MTPAASSTLPRPPPILPSTYQNHSGYEVLNTRMIGQGGIGQLYRGIDRSTHELVAIKAQRYTPAAKVEAFVLQNLAAPHAVRCRDVIEDPANEMSYIIMDLIPEKNIESAFFNPKRPTVRLTLDEIKCISRQVLEFLEDLEAKEIVFGDLKARNLIFLRDSRALTVVDFGGARQSHIVGSPTPHTTHNHQAPEFILNGIPTHYNDRWSLACTLFFLLTGTHLFPMHEDIPREERNNYVLQMIFKRIGWPTSQYLQKCLNTDVYFDDQMEFHKELPVPHLQKWQDEIREASRKNSWPVEDVEKFISIIHKLLRYEHRATPRSLLSHPLFNNEIVIHLSYNPLLKCKMYIARFSTLSKPFEFLFPSDMAGADLTLNFDQPVDECLHLPRDPKGQYLVMLENSVYSSKFVYVFHGNEILDICSFQQNLYEPVLMPNPIPSPEGDYEPPPKRARKN